MPAGDSGYRVDAVNRPIRLESVRLGRFFTAGRSKRR